MALVVGVALVAAVVSLREGAGVVPVPAPSPPPQVDAFTAPGVRVDPVPGPPGPPGDPQFVVVRDTPVLRWAPVPTATGYEVIWHPLTSGTVPPPEQHRRTAVPAVTLTGVPARSSVSVRVVAVDAAGRRSAPLRLATGNLTAAPDDFGPAEFADPFFSASAPDRYRWRLPEGQLACLVRGAGPDLGMLVVRHSCGTVQLRPAVPLQLGAAPGGPRGRISVSADGPGQGGELAVALLPGPDAGLPPGVLDRPGPAAGTAAVDPRLPTGAVLLRISAAGPALSVPAPAVAARGPAPLAVADEPAVQHTWELRITPTVLTVMRDDIEVLTVPVALSWREATAIVAVHPGVDDTGRTLLDSVRMSGPPPPPEAVRVLALSADTAADNAVADNAGPAPVDIPATLLRGATGVQLLGWLSARDPRTVLFGGVAVALRPAGAPAPDGTLAVVADLPVPGPTAPAVLTLGGPAGGALRDAVLEVTRRPTPATEAAAPRVPLATPAAAPLPEPGLQVRPGGGGAPVTLAITVDGMPAQRHYGAPGGYVGVEVLLDGRLVAGIPTAAAGPALGGRYLLRIDPALLTRTTSLRVRVVPATPDTPAATTALTLVP